MSAFNGQARRCVCWLGRASVEAKEQLAQDSRYKRAYDSAMAERTEIEPQLGFVTLTIEWAGGAR